VGEVYIRMSLVVRVYRGMCCRYIYWWVCLCLVPYSQTSKREQGKNKQDVNDL
jgi:hypothetical protein